MEKRTRTQGARRIGRGISARLTYANVMATIAVFGLLAGGGAYAASKIGASDIAKNAVRSKHIKKNAVKTPKIADGAVTAPKLAGQLPFLTPSQGDGRYLPASGQIRLNASPLTWQKISAAPGIDTLGQRPSIGGTTFGGSSMALDNVPVAIEPTLPTVLVGKPLTFVGVNVCYATDPITTLDTARISLTTNTSGGGNTSDLFIDTTNRTDDACRDYTLPAPHVLAPEEDVSLSFEVDYSANAGFFHAGRATFIFQP